MTVLRRSTPSAEGVDPRALLRLLDELDTSEHEPHSLMVSRHGRVVAEAWWDPYRPEQPHLLYSLSKSFTSLAVGLAVEEDLFTPEDRLVDLLPGFGPQPPDERVAAMTVSDALTMTTGHTTDPIITLFPWILEHPEGDWLDGFLGLVPEHEPGWPFTYNQMATHCLARAVEARSGTGLLDFLGSRLLEPLGAGDVETLTQRGHALGFAGFFARTESIAALGQLCLDRGRFGGAQLVPATWIDAATGPQVPNDAANRGAGDPNPDPDWNAGYGYQFWRCRHGFRGDGALGQFCIVWPDEDVVIATTAAAPDMQGMLDLIEETLADAFEHRPADDDVDAEALLRERGASRRLPLPEHVADPDGSGGVTGDVGPSGTFTRAGGAAAPTVDRVVVEPVDGGWTVTLRHDGNPVVLGVGSDSWTDAAWPGERGRREQPLAVAGGLAADGRLRVEAVLLATPHRLLLDVDARAGTFTLDWNQFPLHGAEPSDLAPHA